MPEKKQRRKTQNGQDILAISLAPELLFGDRSTNRQQSRPLERQNLRTKTVWVLQLCSNNTLFTKVSFIYENIVIFRIIITLCENYLIKG